MKKGADTNTSTEVNWDHINGLHESWKKLCTLMNVEQAAEMSRKEVQVGLEILIKENNFNTHPIKLDTLINHCYWYMKFEFSIKFEEFIRDGLQEFGFSEKILRNLIVKMKKEYDFPDRVA